MRIPKRSVKNVVLTASAFYSLVTALNKASSAMLTSDPLKVSPGNIRTNYDPIYERCVTLYREEEVSKNDIKEIARTLSKLKYTIDLVNREIVLTYQQSYMKQYGDVVINIKHENGSMCSEALNSTTQDSSDREREIILYNYSFL